MDVSKLDIISPKIYLYHQESNSHKSNFGGLLSIIFFVVSIIIFIFYLADFISLKFQPTLIYSTYSSENIFYSLSETSINHYIQIYSNINNVTIFEEINTRNVLVYGIKTNFNSNNNINEIEHWLYGICSIKDENNENNEVLENSTTRLINCIKYYYDPLKMKYFDLNEEGFKYPVISTGGEKIKNSGYKIIIEKCNNYSTIIGKLGYCNDEKLINNYLKKYTDIFIFMSDNQIIPNKNHLIIQKYKFSISTNINNNENNQYYENIVYYSILKLKENKNIDLTNKYDEKSVYTINKHFQYEKQNYSSNKKIIAVFNINLLNKVQIYQKECLNFFYLFSLFGGVLHSFFFLLRLINYLFYRFTVIKDINNLLTKVHFAKDFCYDSPKHKMINSRLFKENDKDIKGKRKHPISKINQMKGKRAPSLFEKKTRQKLLNSSKEGIDLKSKTIAIKSKNEDDSEISGIYNNKVKKYSNDKILNKRDHNNKHNNRHSVDGIRKKNTNNLTRNSQKLNNKLILICNAMPNRNNTNYEGGVTHSFPKINKLTTVTKNKYKDLLKIREKQRKSTGNTINNNLGNLINNKSHIIEKHTKKKIPIIDSPKDYLNKKMATQNYESPSLYPKTEFFNGENNNYNNTNKNSRITKIFEKNSLLKVISGDSSNQMFVNNNSYHLMNDIFSKLNDTKNNNTETNNVNKSFSILDNNESGYNSINTFTICSKDLNFSEMIKKDFNQKKNILLNLKYESADIDFTKYLQSLFVRNERFIDTMSILEKFRKKLLSEEHLYKKHLDLLLLKRYFEEEEFEKREKYDIHDMIVDL